MAEQAIREEDRRPATKLQGLERFAGQVFSNSQGKYTLDDYDYYDDTSLISTCAFTVLNGGLLPGRVNTFALFQTPEGLTGQGFPVGYQLTLAETNLQKGQAGGKFPANQAYVAVAGGFDVYCLPKTATSEPTDAFCGGIPLPTADDLSQVINSVTWNWNVGGRQSALLEYEPIKAWPTGFGVYGISGSSGATQFATATQGAALGLANGGPVSSMRKFSFPLMFPPNQAADLTVSVQREICDLTLHEGSLICIAMHLRGYMISKVR